MEQEAKKRRKVKRKRIAKPETNLSLEKQLSKAVEYNNKLQAQLTAMFEANNKTVEELESRLDIALSLSEQKPQPAGEGEVKEVEQVPKATPRVKQTSGRRWWLVWLGLAAFIFGIYFMLQYPDNPTLMNQILSIAGLVIGATGVWYGLKRHERTIITDTSGKVIKQKDLNAVNFYAERGDDGKVRATLVRFEHMDDPEGIPRRLKNDGKLYYVNIWDVEKKALVPFHTPDIWQYYPPYEFARVLTLPAHKRMFTRRPNLFEKVRPWIMIAAIIIMAIIQVVVGGQNAG